ncbi:MULTISPECIES: conjugal transfer protein TraF [unclassified Oceanobacter]|uniref:conjugal transfer protein TraF n=2 Tax=Gammaproteobacteria TaxID=1236 RepID=UPI0026E4368D|nr:MULTISPECIES: conjugal transfer protein TraF [unclassified Oceanobacter]MDO6683139.1 conjugal transfer protein TraF [Oceanobacter sp. 5_MG-2023]MDP2610454.1 conjugal transfer protein TraF [Oceanobacter sp. 1_MG-2023]MDP2613691.1 conjugal transfer protein TraF [Oceanobacter sp. 2_MG-2023]
MMTRSLLAIAIATLGAASVQATPFLPMDARGLAMGNTGVASAQRAHAPAYNPSLLSQAEHDDDFAILFPQLGLSIADEEEMYDTFIDMNDELIPEFEALFDNAENNNFNQHLEELDNASQALYDALDSLSANDVNNVDETIAELRAKNNNLQSALDTVNDDLKQVDSLTDQLTSDLTSISGNPFSGRLGTSAAIALPSKRFAAAISLSANVTFSGRVGYSSNDNNLINGYGDAASGYVDDADALSTDFDALLNDAENGDVTEDDLDWITTQAENTSNYTSDSISTAAGDISIIENGQLSSEAEDTDMDSYLEMVGVAVSDLGISFSREFSIWDKKVAIGITPKYQRVITLHYAAEADYEGDIDEQDLEDASETFNQFNVDLGASFRFGATNKWVFGLVGKNLIGKTYQAKEVVIRGSADSTTLAGPKISLNPQFRAGLAFNGNWTTVALDVDLTENDPVAWENPTQYVAVGAEFDIYNTLQLRAGYRTNLSVSDAEVASIGFGFSPFGVHIDIAAMANPNDVEKEAGIALETGFYF